MTSPYIKLKINLNNLKKIKVSNNDKLFNDNNLFIHKNFNLKNINFKTFQIILIGNPIISNQSFLINIFKNLVI